MNLKTLISRIVLIATLALTGGQTNIQAKKTVLDFCFNMYRCPEPECTNRFSSFDPQGFIMHADVRHGACGVCYLKKLSKGEKPERLTKLTESRAHIKAAHPVEYEPVFNDHVFIECAIAAASALIDKQKAGEAKQDAKVSLQTILQFEAQVRRLRAEKQKEQARVEKKKELLRKKRKRQQDTSQNASAKKLNQNVKRQKTDKTFTNGSQAKPVSQQIKQAKQAQTTSQERLDVALENTNVSDQDISFSTPIVQMKAGYEAFRLPSGVDGFYNLTAQLKELRSWANEPNAVAAICKILQKQNQEIDEAANTLVNLKNVKDFK